MMSRSGHEHCYVPEVELGPSMSPTQPMMSCSCVADSDWMPLIMAACPWRVVRDHFGLGEPSEVWGVPGALPDDTGGMSATGCGGVAGGDRIPWRDEAWRVAAMGR
jgi:hypothetical protein